MTEWGPSTRAGDALAHYQDKVRNLLPRRKEKERRERVEIEIQAVLSPSLHLWLCSLSDESQQEARGLGSGADVMGSWGTEDGEAEAQIWRVAESVVTVCSFCSSLQK